MDDLFYVTITIALLEIGWIIISIIMIVKFFQIASDVRETKMLFIEFLGKNENKNIYEKLDYSNELSYKDWKKENPGKTLNDYYALIKKQS
jgi:hypothetical protein